MAYNKGNNQQPKTKKDLSDYIGVNERIQKFWKDHPNGRIYTEIVKWDGNLIVMRAEGYKDINDDKPFAVGHAYEEIGSNYINSTSALENCETSCIGRMLGIGSYEIKKSVATREEVERAIELQEAKKQIAAATLPDDAPEFIKPLAQDISEDKKEASRILWISMNGDSKDEGFEEFYTKYKKMGKTDDEIYKHLFNVKQDKDKAAG